MLLQLLLFFALMCTACADDNPPLVAGDTSGSALRYLALGDSYTIGHAVPADERWPVLLAGELEQAGVRVAATDIIARTGWTTGELIAAIGAQDPPADYGLVSLLIGVNNQYRGRSLEEYRSEFEELLLTAVALAGGKAERVFVVSIPDYGFTPYGSSNQETISEAIDAFNAAARTITEARGIRWFDITPISREGLEKPAYVAGDGLHPSGDQYRAWVAHIRAGVLEMAGD